MRVLHVVTTDQRRGAETMALTLMDGLVARGHDCRVVALAHSGTAHVHDVPVLPGRGRLGPRTLLALRRAAAGHDVVLAHGSTTLDACAAALVGASAPPFVYANIGDPHYWARDAVRRLRVRLLLRRAARVAALSDRSRQVLERDFKVTPDRLRVITNGRDPDHYQPPSHLERETARLALGLRPEDDVVLLLGALSAEKLVDVAVSTIAELSDGVLLLSGDGPLRTELESLAEQVAPGRVRFLGQQPDVRPLLAAADVLLLTSASEGLPGVLIEAGMSGLPVVATDVGFVRDVVQPGRTGVLVPPRDVAATAAALRLALTQRDVWGRQARAWCATTFSNADLVDSWEQLLREAVQD